MGETMKECIACAEEIKESAKLCKHCGVMQSDPSYLSPSQFESAQKVWDSVAALERFSSSEQAKEWFAELTTSLEVLELLASDSSSEVRAKVAENELASTKIIAALAKRLESDRLLETGYSNSLDRLESALYTHPNAPSELLRKASLEEDDSMREQVAAHPSLSQQTLKLLAADENDGVRAAVAANPSTPILILNKLAHDSSWLVRSRVAGNEALPPESLRALASDEERYVYEHVLSRPDVEPEVIFSTLDRFMRHEELGLDDDGEVEFSLAALFEQVGRRNREAQLALDSAEADELDDKRGELDGYTLVFDFMSEFDLDQMEPWWEDLKDFLEDHMGETDYFDDEAYDETERDYELGKWVALERIYLAHSAQELMLEEE